MTLTVHKPFKTALRRFAVGDDVPANVDLVPHDIADLKKRHFVAAQEAKTAKVAKVAK